MAAGKAGSMFGKYQLNRLLGQGGMGEVYEARDTSKDRTVALKILPEELSRDDGFRARFQRESRAAAMLEEPHVIPIHDWGEIDGNLYIDMRLVRGQDLHELLQRGPLEPERAVGIIRQIAAALDAAHAQGLIHRDVKPQNILITAVEDFAYLIDFGIAQNRGDTRLTVAGSAIGSFAYMAPERFEDRPTTPAVDTYSLASVLYEALTGQPPFKVGSMEQVIAAHLSSPPPQPSAINPRVPAGFDDVIARGMAKDPDDRYGSPGALGRAAQRALGATPSRGPVPDRTHSLKPPPPTRPPRRQLRADPCGMARRATTLIGPAATLDQPRPPMADAGGDHHGRGADPGRHRYGDRTTCPTELHPTHQRPTHQRIHRPDTDTVLSIRRTAPSPPTQLSPAAQPTIAGPPGTDGQGWIALPGRAVRPGNSARSDRPHDTISIGGLPNSARNLLLPRCSPQRRRQH